MLLLIDGKQHKEKGSNSSEWLGMIPKAICSAKTVNLLFN